MKRRRKNNKKKGMLKRSPKVVLLSVVCVLFLAGSIFMAIYGSTMGGELSLIETEGEQLEKANQELTKRLVKNTSLLKAQKDADELGFVRPADKLYIDTDSLVARLP